MTKDDPVDVGVLELLGRDLTGESTSELCVGVLGSDGDGRLDGVLDLEQVNRRRGDDDLLKS